MPTHNPDLFRKKYVIPTIRMRGWDYAGTGSYFITICTGGRVPWFGEIRNGVMGLSGIGRVVHDEWEQTAIIRPYVILDEFVIMPDHFHSIITIDRTQAPVDRRVVQTPRRGVCTNDNPPIDNNPFHKPEWKPGSLGSIINQFKSACTKRIRTMGHDNFAWQPRYHEHLIRSDMEMMRIRKYIVDNPSAWTRDH